MSGWVQWAKRSWVDGTTMHHNQQWGEGAAARHSVQVQGKRTHAHAECSFYRSAMVKWWKKKRCRQRCDIIVCGTVCLNVAVTFPRWRRWPVVAWATGPRWNPSPLRKVCCSSQQCHILVWKPFQHCHLLVFSRYSRLCSCAAFETTTVFVAYLNAANADHLASACVSACPSGSVDVSVVCHFLQFFFKRQSYIY